MKTLRRCLRAALTVAAVAQLPAAATAAQETDLTVLLVEADGANQELLAARREAEAARARIPQAGALPDPVVGFGVMNVPVASPSLGRDMMTMTTIQLGERLPWPGKLGLREGTARSRAEAAVWEVEAVGNRVRSRVKAEYYRVYFIDRAIEVTVRNERLLTDFAQVTAARYGVGTAAQPDVLKAQVERTRLDDQLVALREQRAGAVARLNALVGRSPDTPLPGAELPGDVRAAALDAPADLHFASGALSGVLDDGGGGSVQGLPTIEELRRLALQHNPAIQAWKQRVAAEQQALALARLATRPDIQLSASYGRRPELGDFFSFNVSLPVPVFAGRKQNQAVVEGTATLGRREAELAEAVDALNAEITSLVAALARSRDQLVLLMDGILPQARATLASATASYRVGRVDFLTLLDAQVTLYRHELDYHRKLTDFATDLAALERAVGTEILP